MNRDAQKRYAGMGLATAAQYGNFDPGVINRTALDQSIEAMNRTGSTEQRYKK